MPSSREPHGRSPPTTCGQPTCAHCGTTPRPLLPSDVEWIDAMSHCISVRCQRRSCRGVAGAFWDKYASCAIRAGDGSYTKLASQASFFVVLRLDFAPVVSEGAPYEIAILQASERLRNVWYLASDGARSTPDGLVVWDVNGERPIKFSAVRGKANHLSATAA